MIYSRLLNSGIQSNFKSHLHEASPTLIGLCIRLKERVHNFAELLQRRVNLMLLISLCYYEARRLRTCLSYKTTSTAPWRTNVVKFKILFSRLWANVKFTHGVHLITSLWYWRASTNFIETFPRYLSNSLVAVNLIHLQMTRTRQANLNFIEVFRTLRLDTGILRGNRQPC